MIDKLKQHPIIAAVVFMAAATTTLAQKDPRNPFFRYLNEGNSATVSDLTLEKCPAPNNLPTQPLYQWQWEREEADRAWEHSSYWDCIFMANLLR